MIRKGDKVLVEAIVTEIFDDDPHDPSVAIYFNGQSAATTIMNLRKVPPTPTLKACEFCGKYSCDGQCADGDL